MHSVVIVANGIRKDNARLQPWRYVHEIAQALATRYKVTLLTDGNEEAWQSDNVTIQPCPHLGVRHIRDLRGQLERLSPDILFWSTTPRTIAYRGLLLSLPYPVVPFITAPLYEWREMFRSIRAGVPVRETRALWQQRLVPRSLFARFLNHPGFSRIIVQSDANLHRLKDMGVAEDKLIKLPVGRDRAVTEVAEQGDEFRLLYLGALRRIRGFDAFMRIWPELMTQCQDCRITVLARGDEPGAAQKARQLIDGQSWQDRVNIIEGWLAPEQVQAHIAACSAVVLPFVLVPSDVPIAVIEALAYAKPVIGGDVDGIPELIENRGVVIDPLNQQSFVNTILALRDHDTRQAMSENARAFMHDYPDWQQVGKQVLEIVEACHDR